MRYSRATAVQRAREISDRGLLRMPIHDRDAMTGRSAPLDRRQASASGIHLRCAWCRCQHGAVTTMYSGHPRAATADDGLRLLSLWTILFDEDDSAAHEPWRTHARK